MTTAEKRAHVGIPPGGNPPAGAGVEYYRRRLRARIRYFLRLLERAAPSASAVVAPPTVEREPAAPPQEDGRFRHPDVVDDRLDTDLTVPRIQVAGPRRCRFCGAPVKRKVTMEQVMPHRRWWFW